jgi:hypothetical protein
MGRAGRNCPQRHPDGVLSCATEHLSRHSPLPSFTRMDASKITAQDHIGCVLLHRAYVRKRIFATESSKSMLIPNLDESACLSEYGVMVRNEAGS